MPLSGGLLSLKDPNTHGESYQPLLLVQFSFVDGSSLYCSTHNINAAEGGSTYNGNSYVGRIDKQDIAAIQARSQQGTDGISDVTLHINNADQLIYNTYEIGAGKGFKGARVQLVMVLMDIDPATGGYVFSNDSPAPVKFSGICDAPNCEDAGRIMTVRATTSHNMARVTFPNIPVQQRCVNPFPGTAAQRLAGASDMSSWFYSCGYCPDQAATDPVTGLSATRGSTTTPLATDPQGNVIADSSGVFVICGQTKTDCVARGMYDKDSALRLTRRFTAIQWAPDRRESQSIKYKSGSVTVFSSRNDSIYARNYPMVYGEQWVKQPIVCNILGDGNSTRFEVVICAGDIGDASAIWQVVVNGVIVPKNGTGGFQNNLFRWDLISTGNRTGNFTLDAGYDGKGDPYGSLAMMEIVVYAELAASNSTPDVKVLFQGPKIKTPNTVNPSDQPTWPYVPTTLPPWVLLDLLIEGNYAYSEIDLQSFIDAANYCGQQVTYIDLHGVSQRHNRFEAMLALEEKRGGQEVIQALLRSFNAQLVPNSETGLLQLFIRQTLAEQQPASINGSNYNTPVLSMKADGTVASGYVAYLIDESVIQHDGRGVPKMRGPYTNATAQSPNRLSWPFQDADNQYADDSISVVDPADVARAGGYQAGGQQVPQQLAVLGISSFDQGIRIANVNLAENFRMNESRDTRGTRRWDIEATSRLEHLRVGQICLLQYQAINAPTGLGPLVSLQSPPGANIPGVLVRVETIRPATNYERATFTFVMHEDYVYTDSYGQHAAPPYSDPAQALPARPPYGWDPYGEQPIVGDAMYDRTTWGFQIAQSYDHAADGSALGKLAIGGCAPVNQFGSAYPPLMNSQADQAVGWGTFSAGQRIYAAIAAQDSAGKWSPLSKPCFADIQANLSTFVTPTIYWQTGTVAWAIFAGISDQHWSAQLAHGQASMIGTGTPDTITLDGLALQTVGAPDALADSLLFQVKLIVHGGDWGDVVGTVAANTLSFPAAAGGTVDLWKGRVLSLYAGIQGSTGNVPIADFTVTGSSIAGDFAVTPDPAALGIVAGMVFVMRCQFTVDATGTVMTDALLVNPYAAGGLTADAEVGNFARILSGTGAGQIPRQIVANTSTTLTVNPAWDVPPDATSVVIIEESAWHPAQTAKQSTSDLMPAPSTVATLNVINYSQQAILVEALVSDSRGRTSLEPFSPVRELYVWGGAGEIGNSGVTVNGVPVTY